jgi:hypothetical protein
MYIAFSPTRPRWHLIASEPDRTFMSRIVCKFGGTSVADIDRIQATADRVKSIVDEGNQVAVVVSAMSGTTDQLISWMWFLLRASK